MSTEGGMLELGELCKKWGVEPKKIEEVGLNVLGSTGGYTAGMVKKRLDTYTILFVYSVT